MGGDVEPQLLAQITERPRDEHARRVYADRLLDRGDPRGELIALQLAHADPDRVAALLREHAIHWVAPLGPYVDARACAFDGGFLSEVVLRTVDAHLAPVVGHPVWATVRTLHLGSIGRDRRMLRDKMLVVETLIGHPMMHSLERVTEGPRREELMLVPDRDGVRRFVPRFGRS